MKQQTNQKDSAKQNKTKQNKKRETEEVLKKLRQVL